jgi:hypothetical protein
MSRAPSHPLATRLRASLRRARLRAVLEIALAGLSWLLPGLGGLLLAAMLLPRTPAVAWVLSGLAWALVAGFLLWGLVSYRRWSPTLVGFAARLERRAGLAENELVNALALEGRAAGADPFQRELIQRIVQRATAVHDRLPIARLVRNRELRSPAWRMLGTAAGILLVSLLAPHPFRQSVAMLAAPATVEPPLVLIRVTPGDLALDRGDDVEVAATIQATEELPPAVLFVRGADGVWRKKPMEPVSSGETATYRARIEEVQTDLLYAVAAGRHRSREYRIEVREPLRAMGYRLQIQWPDYTGLVPEDRLASRADLAALPGSRVRLTVVPSRPGARGRLQWAHAEPLPLAPADRGDLVAEWTVERADSFRVELTDSVGGHWVSEPFALDLLVDQPPVVQVLSPAGDLNLPPEMEILLDVECLDDYGLGELALVYSRAWEPPERRVLARWETARQARVTQPWDLEELGLLPGQDLSFFLELTDNDRVSGPKVTRSRLFTIHFPSLAEMYAQQETEREEEIQDLSEMLEEQHQLQKSLEEISREMLRQEEISWEKQKELEQILERQEKLAKKVDELSQALERSLQRMEEQSLFTPEMLEKIRQIQELASQIQSEEFRQYLEAMRQAMESLDRRKLQEAMEKFQITQEELRKGLDRTLQLLKRLLAEEKLSRALQEAQKLAMQQEALNQKLEESLGEEGEKLSEAERQALAEEQERLAQEAAQLQEELADLEQAASEAAKELQEMLEQLRRRNLLQEAQESMTACSQAMKQGQGQQSLEFGRKAQQRMAALAAGLQQAMEAMQRQLSEEVVRGLFAVSHQLVDVSRTQEELLDRQEYSPTQDLATEEQSLLETVRSSLDSLAALGRKTPVIGMAEARALGEALRRMEEAMSFFERGQRLPGVAMARASREAMDEAIRNLLETQSSMCRSPSGNPSRRCMNKLQSLAGEQSQLNQQTQQLLGQAQGSRLTPSQSQEVLRAAARQEMIRRGLQEVAEEVGSQRNILGRLDELAKEMEEIANEMRTRGIDERILRRQERILSRLLTAQRSIRRQDEREERISRPGQNPETRESPPPLALRPTAREQLLKGILQGGKDPIPADYRSLVEEYWKALLAEP